MPGLASAPRVREAERKLEELRAFFDFAFKSNSIAVAAVWPEFLRARDRHAERFVHTMATDKRLSKQHKRLNLRLCRRCVTPPAQHMESQARRDKMRLGLL